MMPGIFTECDGLFIAAVAVHQACFIVRDSETSANNRRPILTTEPAMQQGALAADGA
jgi:hypothetical protein